MKSMTVEIYVQARMGSTRLPGKVMMQVLGQPLLKFQIERLQQVKQADAIVILTTTSPKDDVIVDFCKENRILCYRGPEDDVLGRYYQSAQKRKPDTIVRITADCPLIDPEVVDEVITAFKDSSPPYDYVSNSLISTYPRGLDTEVFSFSALEKAFHNGHEPYEREHVTPYLYGHPELFRLKNVASPVNLAHHRWTVDTPEDFHLIRLILENLYPKNPQFRLKDVLGLMEKHPDWVAINAHIQQKDPKQRYG